MSVKVGCDARDEMWVRTKVGGAGTTRCIQRIQLDGPRRPGVVVVCYER